VPKGLRREKGIYRVALLAKEELLMKWLTALVIAHLKASFLNNCV